MKEPKTERVSWLNSTVVGIGLASLCSDLGHEMATTAMPALLASLAPSLLGASVVLGVIEGLADGLSSFAKLFSGLYSDRLEKRKPIAVAGYFVTAAGMASFVLATQWWHVLIARVGGWLGRGVRSPVRNVLLTEATEPTTYGRAFGFERAMDSAGAVIGPLLALLLVWALGRHWKWVFVCTLLPGIAAALLIGLMVREKPHAPQPHVHLWGGMKSLPRPFLKYLTGVGIAGAGNFSNTFLILWATQAWTPRFGAAHAAMLGMAFYVGYNIIYTICCYVSGTLADRFPKHWVLSTGYALAVVPAGALIWPGASILKFAIAFAFSGLYMGVWETVESSTSATMLPGNVRGVGFGLLATVNGIGLLISSILVGLLWRLAPPAAMGYVIVVSLVGAGMIASTRPVAAGGAEPELARSQEPDTAGQT
jgi:MFS family permease